MQSVGVAIVSVLGSRLRAGKKAQMGLWDLGWGGGHGEGARRSWGGTRWPRRQSWGGAQQGVLGTAAPRSFVTVGLQSLWLCSWGWNHQSREWIQGFT